MKTIPMLAPVLLSGLLAISIAAPVAAADGEAAGPAKYVGAETCAKTCHKTEKQGEQLGKWLAGPHAKAYKTLASDEAKKIAKAKGIADPQKAPECLGCHSTGYGKPAASFAETFDPTEGVGCEACHGPGSNYKKQSIMKDESAAIAAGLLIPDEKLCKTCHNEKSPSYKPFDYKERAALIAHPRPPKASE